MPVWIRSCVGWGVAFLFLSVAASALADPLQVEGGNQDLPTAIVGASYLQSLQAVGGAPPYSWTGTVPASLDMTLSSRGLLIGTPQQATKGPVQFIVVVTDSAGTQAQATLSITVIFINPLAIATPFLQTGFVGIDYDQAIIGGDNASASAAFAWSLADESVLPTGVQFQSIGTPASAHLSGVPAEAGIFPLVVNLSDDLGHSTVRQFILNISGDFPLPQQSLDVATAGASYSAQLQARHSSSPIWSIAFGELPPGLSLSETGAITGTVPAGTPAGSFDFVALANDVPEGIEESGALQIEVQAGPGGGGCATGEGPLGAGLLGLIWVRRHGRRRHRP